MLFPLAFTPGSANIATLAARACAGPVGLAWRQPHPAERTVTASNQGKIFISYRRQETAWPARQLYEVLVGRFGVESVFKDVDDIEPGDDFVDKITGAVAACDVLLALIGTQWLTLTDDRGRRRLDNPEDFVRLEIKAALSRGVRVVPILVDGAKMPSGDQLPEELGALTRRQAVEINPIGFNTDRLLATLAATFAAARPTVTTAEPLDAGQVIPEPEPPWQPEEPPVVVPEEPPVVVPEQPPVVVPEQPPVVVPEEPPVVVPEQPTVVVPEEPPVVLPELPPTVVTEPPSAVVPEQPLTVVPEAPPVVLPELAAAAASEEPPATVPEQPPPAVPQPPAPVPEQQPDVSYHPPRVPDEQPAASEPPAPPSQPAPSVTPAGKPGSRRPLVLVAVGVVVALLVGTLLVLRPWAGRPTAEGVPTPTDALTPTPSGSGSPNAGGAGPLILAHRGGLEQHQFETQQAMEAAAAAGFSIETDVRYTADGVAVLVHDEKATKGLDCDGRSISVSETTWADLNKYCKSKPTAKDPTQYPIPRLDNTLEGIAAASDEAMVFLEVKTEQTAAQRAAFLNEPAKFGLRDRIVVTSFNRDWLQAIAKADSATKRMLFVSGTQVPASDLGDLKLWAVGVEQGVATKEYVDDLLAIGVKVMIWTLNDPKQWTTFFAYNPDVMMTDYPAKLKAWLANR